MECFENQRDLKKHTPRNGLKLRHKARKNRVVHNLLHFFLLFCLLCYNDTNPLPVLSLFFSTLSFN